MHKIKKLFQIVSKMKAIPASEDKKQLLNPYFLTFDYLKVKKMGASLDDYIMYHFYELNNEKRRDYVLEDECVNTLPDLYNDSSYRHILDNKIDFDVFFKDVLGRDFLIVDDRTTEESFKNFTLGKKSLMIKPVAGWCGQGVKIIKVHDYPSISVLLNELKKYGLVLIEDVLEQDSNMSSLNCDSINTIRVLSLIDNNGKISIPLASLRIGRKGFCVDNFHSHGLVAIVDVKSGSVITKAIDTNGNRYEYHPDSGVKIEGFTIPNWSRVIELVHNLASRVPSLRYVGWDIAVNKTGNPVAIEGNSNSAADVFQTPMGKGIRDIIESNLGPF